MKTDHNGDTVTMVYDMASRLLQRDYRTRVNSPSGSIADSDTFTNDPNGNKLSETWTGAMAVWNFTTEDSGDPNFPDGHDVEDRFRRFDRPGRNEQIDLARSAIGNINDLIFNGTSNARQYSPVYELTDLAGTAQTFDNRGNLTHSHTGIDLEWDAENRLSRTIVDATDTAGIAGTNDYLYDATGKRVARKITRNGSVASHTIFIHAGPNCIAEYTAGAAPTSPDQEYVHADGIDSLVLISRNNDTSRYLATRNQQWSVVALVDLADGSVVERYTYDIFGTRRILDSAAVEIGSTQYHNPYGYTARRHDAESSLIYFRARHYDPTTGEFLSRDPLGYVDGMSLYRAYFVPGDVDPDGAEKWVVDENNCIVIREIWIQLNFVASGTRNGVVINNGAWTAARKQTFITQMKNRIKSTFNNNRFRIRPSRFSYLCRFGFSCCPCPCARFGLKPHLELHISENYWGEDYTYEVLSNPAGRFIQSSATVGGGSGIDGWMDEADVTARPSGQIPIVHEFGHSIGLQHPGFGIPGVTNPYATPPGGVDRSGRSVGGSDLMGGGRGMRAFYFDDWEKKANSELDRSCGPWNLR